MVSKTGVASIPQISLSWLNAPAAAENSAWGEERMVTELKRKLGIRVLPRTVGRYLARVPANNPVSSG